MSTLNVRWGYNVHLDILIFISDHLIKRKKHNTETDIDKPFRFYLVIRRVVLIEFRFLDSFQYKCTISAN